MSSFTFTEFTYGLMRTIHSRELTISGRIHRVFLEQGYDQTEEVKVLGGCLVA